MVAIKNIVCFVASVSALTVSSRDTPTTVLTNLGLLNTQTTALTAAVNIYVGGSTSVGPVTSAVNNLETTLVTSTTAASTIVTLSSADSKAVVTALTNLTSSLEAALTAFEAKIAQFAASNLIPLVQQDLKTLEADYDTYTTLLYNIVSSDTKAGVQSQTISVNSAFAASINAFS